MSITAYYTTKQNAKMHLNLWGHFSVLFLQMNQLAKMNQTFQVISPVFIILEPVLPNF